MIKMLHRTIDALILCIIISANFSDTAHSEDLDSSQQPQKVEVMVPSGTPVSLVATDWIAAGNPAGTVLGFRAAAEVLVDGLLVVSEEAEAKGHLLGYSSVRAAKAITGGTLSKLVSKEEASAILWQPTVAEESREKLCALIELDWVRCVDGRKLRLRGKFIVRAAGTNSPDWIYGVPDISRQWMLSPRLKIQASVASFGKVTTSKRKPAAWYNRFAN